MNGASVSAHFASVPINPSEGSRLEIYDRKGALVITAPGLLNMGPNTLLGGHAGETMTEMTVPDRFKLVPDATAGGSKLHQARWSYLPADGDPDTVTTITFAGGAVSDVSRKVVKR